VSLKLVPPQPRDESWRQRLLLTEKKTIRNHSANVAVFLQDHAILRGCVAWDSFAERIIVTRAIPWDREFAPSEATGSVWAEEDSVRLSGWLARNEGWAVKVGVINEALPGFAKTRQVCPPRDYLLSARWDGTRRLPTWLSTYCGALATPYSEAVGVRWMIQAVARIMEPGCQADLTLILESPEQGTGKSSTFRALVPNPEWHSETGITIGDKDSYQSLHGVWIYVFDELASIVRGDSEGAKTFLTALHDHYRPPYARLTVNFPRRNVFAGTTNRGEYFVDATGNRRYVPIRVVSAADIEAIIRDRDLLWAEAVAMYEGKVKWHAETADVRAMFAEEQASRVQADDWEPRVANWLARPMVTTWEPETPGGPPRKTSAPYDASRGFLTLDVLLYAVGKPAERISNRDSQRVAEVLRSLGYERGPLTTENGARVRRFHPKA
jgi:putative DNA primase/helicase